ncbi:MULTISPECIES: RNA-binding protein [Aerococcus]|uniref:S4 domain-containing protein YlmH n=1 Tax=Aerococcus viridans TaxID=1377 RepID=A0A2N6UF58_9LACT|nr:MULTISPECIES: YlmH/Sll1252 family protein [Aerococcus]OFU51318.1 S4 domain-containing protein YlmH [Aerococcus sp. HMSC10H05]PMC80165.1 S4 domain-containing protein YlmH [Aerococcus viridans]
MANIEVLQHFQPDEHAFVEKVTDWKNLVLDQYAPIVTPFLNPREVAIVKLIIGQDNEMHYDFFGGYPNAENQRCVLAPSYYTIQPEDFEITPFDIHYASKFNTLEHRQILGTILGQGVERNRLGDIIQAGAKWQFFVDKAIADFLSFQMDKIGGTKIKLVQIHHSDQIIQPQSDWQPMEITLSSLRFDTIISDGFRIPRAKAKLLIEGGAAKLNWSLVQDAKRQLSPGDIASVRGYGRLKYVATQMETKKGKIRVAIEVIKNK